MTQRGAGLVAGLNGTLLLLLGAGVCVPVPVAAMDRPATIHHPADQFAPGYEPTYVDPKKQFKGATGPSEKVLGHIRNHNFEKDRQAQDAWKIVSEWVDLIDIHKAPSTREDELYRQWMTSSPSPTAEETLSGFKKYMLPDGQMQPDHWGLAHNARVLANRLFLGDRACLESACLLSERTMSQVNDPNTGVIFDQYGKGTRPPIFWKVTSPNNAVDQMRAWGVENPDSYEGKTVHHTTWLMTGNSLAGPLRIMRWILEHPEVHNKPAPQIPGYVCQTGKTYRGKVETWLVQVKAILCFFERHHLFDEQAGMWQIQRYNPRGRKVELHYLPHNRWLNFTASYLQAGHALDLLDPARYGAWYEHSRKRTRQGIGYFKESWNLELFGGRYPTGNRYGRLGVWGYSRNSSSEDFMHLGMDTEPLRRILTIFPEAIAEADLEAIANTIFSGEYCYKTHTRFQGLFRGVHRPVGDRIYTYGPRFGGFIAPHLSDEMYDTMANEHLFIIREWMNRKYYINRILTRWNPPVDLYEMRKARYAGKTMTQ